MACTERHISDLPNRFRLPHCFIPLLYMSKNRLSMLYSLAYFNIFKFDLFSIFNSIRIFPSFLPYVFIIQQSAFIVKSKFFEIGICSKYTWERSSWDHLDDSSKRKHHHCRFFSCESHSDCRIFWKKI